MAFATKLTTDLVEAGGAALAGAGIHGAFKVFGGNPDTDHANVLLASLGVGALSLLGASNLGGLGASFLQGVSGGAMGVAGYKLYQLIAGSTTGFRTFGPRIGRPIRTATPVLAVPTPPALPVSSGVIEI